jgi:hypothetical protein
LAQEIAKHINYEVILTESATQMTKAELKELYKRSFVGMRLRGFDGASATVSEMALMGRYTVWTGGTPTALPWSTPEDIVAHINRQATTIGQTDTGTAIFMRKYLDTGTAWLNC